MKKTILGLVASTFIAGVAHAAPAPVTFTGHATTGAECSAQFDEIGGINVKELSERKQCLAVVHDIDTMFTHKTFWVRTGNQFVAFDVEDLGKMNRTERVAKIKTDVVAAAILAEVNKQLEMAEEAIVSLESDVKALEVAKEAVRAAGEEAVAAVQAKLDMAMTDLAMANGRIIELEGIETKLRGDITDLEVKVNTVTAERDTARADATYWQDQRDQERFFKDHYRDQRDAAREEVRVANDTIVDLRDELGDVYDELDDAEQKIIDQAETITARNNYILGMVNRRLDVIGQLYTALGVAAADYNGMSYTDIEDALIAKVAGLEDAARRDELAALSALSGITFSTTDTTQQRREILAQYITSAFEVLGAYGSIDEAQRIAIEEARARATAAGWGNDNLYNAEFVVSGDGTGQYRGYVAGYNKAVFETTPDTTVSASAEYDSDHTDNLLENNYAIIVDGVKIADVDVTIVGTQTFDYVAAGFDAGFAEGFERGFADGFKAGYERGFEDGYDLGYREGFTAGVASVQ